MRRTWRLAQHALAELLGRTVGELRATMTLPEFLSWQGYFRARQRQAAEPAEPPPLAGQSPAGIARALGGGR